MFESLKFSNSLMKSNPIKFDEPKCYIENKTETESATILCVTRLSLIVNNVDLSSRMVKQHVNCIARINSFQCV